MEEPSRANSRRALAGGVAAAIALAGTGFVVGRNTAARDVPPPAPAPSIPVPAASPEPALQVIDPVLDRAALLEALRAAVDAAASGQALPPQVATLEGRRFEIRLPFGCHGPADAKAAVAWMYDADRETLRISAAPAQFAPADWVAPNAADVELAEGFWIERPWTSSEACPPAPSPAAPPPERSAAIVQFHTTAGSRIGRREGDAFQTAQKVALDDLDLSGGLRLRLTGRLTLAPGGSGPVICRPSSAAQRPACLFVVSFEEVGIEMADGASLATWEVSSARTAEN